MIFPGQSELEESTALHRPATIAFTSILLLAALSMAQPFGVELDLDGQLGNGPDFSYAAVGEYISLDIWITGSTGELNGFGIRFCEDADALEFQAAAEPPIPGSWAFSTPDVDGQCVTIGASNYAGTGPNPPIRVSTVTFLASVDNIITNLSVDTSAGGWLNEFAQSGAFETGIGASIQIGSMTGNDESSWGDVKQVFR